MSVHTNRVVVLVDMDCFYCQVEEKLDPSLKGKPVTVLQYNKSNVIVAVNYLARDLGVTRQMRGDEAKEKCPDLQLVRVPTSRGRPDISRYRDAGKQVADVLQRFTSLLQRASVDEAYLDITEAVNNRLNEKLTINHLQNTHIVGFQLEQFLNEIYEGELRTEPDLKLAIGGAIVEEIRAAVYEQTGYRCSAGIAHNKILAKLACGLHKPNQQTILTQDGVAILYETLPVRKIQSLGGKFGNLLAEKLNIKYMGELAKFTEQELLKKYDEKTASWLYNIARGIDTEPVTIRLISKSIACCKKFPGKSALKTLEDVTHWLKELAEDVSERLEQDFNTNTRRAKQLVINFAQEVKKKDLHSSRTQVLNSYDPKRIASDGLEVLKKYTQKPDGTFHLKYLGFSVGKFEDCKNQNDIATFFKSLVQTVPKEKKKTEVIEEQSEEKSDNLTEEVEYSNKTIEKDYSEILKNKIEFPQMNAENPFPFGDTSKSFFLRYLKNRSPAKTAPPPPPNETPSCSYNNFQFKEEKICPKCDRKIPELEFSTHMDHHIAMELMTEEKQLYQIERQQKQEIKNNKSIKRKLINSDTSTASNITSFLVKKTDNNNVKHCNECDKEIPMEEFNCHLDFHAAKKLHSELNPVIVNQNKVIHTDNKNTVKKKFKNNKPTNTLSIAHFFKPL